MALVEENHENYDLFDQLLGDSPHYGANNFDFDKIDNLSSDGQLTHGSIDPIPAVKKFTKRPKTHCTCEKSQCNMKYCPCFKLGNKCNSSCICTDCCNKKFVAKKVVFAFGSLEHFSLPSFSF